MSTYKEIRGLKVRDYTTNPDNPIEGQLWYNTTDNVARYQIPNVLSSWRTGNNLNMLEDTNGGGWKTNSCISFCRRGSPGNPVAIQKVIMDLTWTEVNDLNTARGFLGSGNIYTSALALYLVEPNLRFSAKTEKWNGSSWTEVNDLNTARNFGRWNRHKYFSFSFCWWCTFR